MSISHLTDIELRRKIALDTDNRVTVAAKYGLIKSDIVKLRKEFAEERKVASGFYEKQKRFSLMVDDYLAGATVAELTKTYNFTRQTVYTILGQRGYIPVSYATETNVSIASEQGLTTEEIAKKYKCSKTTVYNVLKKYGSPVYAGSVRTETGVFKWDAVRWVPATGYEVAEWVGKVPFYTHKP